MIVKAIYKDNNFKYFRDLETKQKRFYGDVFECSDELAKERIKKGYVVEATEEEKKTYVDSIGTFDDEDLKEDKQKSKRKKNNKKQEEPKATDDTTSKENDGTIEPTDNDENKISGDNDKSAEIDENVVSSEQEEQQMIDVINKNCD